MHNMVMPIYCDIKISKLSSAVFDFLTEICETYNDTHSSLTPTWREFTISDESMMLLAMKFPEYNRVIVEHVST